MKKPDLIHPLFCWDVYTMYKSDVLPSKINPHHLNILQQFRKKLDWKVDLSSILSSSYDALVLTDADIIIQWVSDEFELMTGYSPDYIKGKSPRMLQGRGTSPASKKRIREKLEKDASFVEVLTNYKKTGEEYLCRVEIYPIQNSQNITTHFLALETEILK